MLISVYFMRPLPSMGKRTLAKDTNPQRVTIEGTRFGQLDLCSGVPRRWQRIRILSLCGERREHMLSFDTRDRLR